MHIFLLLLVVVNNQIIIFNLIRPHLTQIIVEVVRLAGFKHSIRLEEWRLYRTLNLLCES